MADGSELVKFVGGVGVKGHDFIGFRGSGAVLVGREGLEFRLNEPLGLRQPQRERAAAGR
jgi:hypothetical protein